MNRFLILLGKVISYASKCTNLGGGGTWPGEIALKVNPQIAKYFFSSVKKGVIIIAGTNGKTTTSKMVQEILKAEYPHDTIVHNDSGANLLNGIVSAFIHKANMLKNIQPDWAVLEVDENTLPQLINNLEGIQVQIIVALLNLFRDQLDRYGEVDAIAAKWKKSLKDFKGDIQIIANADDPSIAYIAKESGQKRSFFGSDEKTTNQKVEHATDSMLCPRCGKKLNYKRVFYSHIGDWFCKSCQLARPSIGRLDYVKSNLEGFYNTYNTNAALLTASILGLENESVRETLKNFTPAFGRQEEFEENGKKIKIFLSKNPVGFNESLKTVLELGGEHILLVLNDRIPDGRDVSWIWDVDLEILPKDTQVTVSGDRCYDLGLRIKYAQKQFEIKENIEDAIKKGLENTVSGDVLYILPTYSAMLEVRKILTGKKIL